MTGSSRRVRLRRFVRSVRAELGWRLPSVALVTLGIALTEGVGLLLLVPLLDVVGVDVGAGAAGALATWTAAAFAAVGLEPSLEVVLAAFVSVTIAHAGLLAASLVLNPRLEQRYALALREQLHAAVLAARWSYFGKRRIADVLHALTGEADRAATAVSHLLLVSTSLLITSVYVVIALRLSAPLTLLVGTCGAALLYLLRGRTRRSAALGDEYVAATRRQFRIASDSLNGLKVLKSLGAEDRAAAAFGASARARIATYVELLEGFARSKIVLDAGAAIMMSVLLLVAIRVLRTDGATLLLLIVLFARLMPRVIGLQAAAQTVAANFASVDTILTMTDECRAQAEPPARTAPPVDISREVSLQRVSFTYPDGTIALRDVTLAIPAGRFTAIVGASGAGKSTIADLLLGLLTPGVGRILVDDRPLDEGDVAGWRRGIAYIPQDGFLLADSVRDNMRWAHPSATDEEIWTALERADAAGFVRRRAAGLSTAVGDGGTQFSGGERQRLALARGLLLEPRILVLDEATSALDLATERQILETVAALGTAVTRVVITHRLPAIRHADVIHVLERGRLVESGTWQQLVARGGPFAHLLASQPSDEPGLPTPARAAS